MIGPGGFMQAPTVMAASVSENVPVEYRAIIQAVQMEEPSGLLHSLMSNSERRQARYLVKLGILRKGVADLPKMPVAYFLSGG